MSAIPLRRIEGKYEILGKLREGGMGAIYKVRHRLLEEIRVIKVMRPQFLEDEELKARFLREARLAIKLRHANIAQLYDFTVDDEDGTALIVMEFIDGKTLEDVLGSGGPPPLGLALEIAQQSLRALGYLHGKGFIHRDISPDNLMVTQDAEGQPLVKLIDLGIAKILGGGEGLTQTGTFLGKVRYASPEQFGAAGTAGVDARGDLYSFGIVLYELLTGRYPIPGKDPSSLIAGHMFRPPLDFQESDPGERIPAGLRAAVLKALSKSVGERFAGAQEFSRALAAFRAPGDISDFDLLNLLSFSHQVSSPEPVEPPGSTQERLDEKFGLTATPVPAASTHLERTPVGLQLVAILPAEIETARHRDEERRRELAAAVATIEEDLAGGDLEAAETRLHEAEAAHGLQEAFQDLRRSLEEIRLQRQREEEERRKEAEIEALVTGARRLADEDDFKAALRDLRKAAKLAGPSNPSIAGVELRALIEEIEERSRRRIAEKKRAARIAKAVAAIEARLAAGDLERAEELLGKAQTESDTPDEAEIFSPLRLRLAELRRAGELQAAVAAIGAALDSGDLDAAGTLLDRAVHQFGGDAALRGSWERLEALRHAEHERLEALRRAEHERQLKSVLASAKKLQAGGELDAALGAARKAAELAPESREARALRVEIETALLRRELDIRIAALVHDGRRLEAAGDLPAAVKKLHEAADLDAENAEVHACLAAMEAELHRREEERRREGELAVTAAAADSLLQRGELDEAERLVARSLADHLVDHEELHSLRAHIQELRRNRAAETLAPPVAPAPAPEMTEDVWEAAHAIAERLAERDTEGALKELHHAEAHFGQNEAFTRLRKSLADVVFEEPAAAQQSATDLPLQTIQPAAPVPAVSNPQPEPGRFAKLLKKLTG